MKVSKETIIRTSVLLLALANLVLTASGHTILPFDSEELTEAITLVFTVGASLWAWWKNNSFTNEAIEADEYLKALRHTKE